jgi:hypothetical protein
MPLRALFRIVGARARIEDPFLTKTSFNPDPVTDTPADRQALSSWRVRRVVSEDLPKTIWRELDPTRIDRRPYVASYRYNTVAFRAPTRPCTASVVRDNNKIITRIEQQQQQQQQQLHSYVA